ncbi:MAG: hypothetical protein ACI9W5_000605 [Ulvibacter sp.]
MTKKLILLNMKVFTRLGVRLDIALHKESEN